VPPAAFAGSTGGVPLVETVVAGMGGAPWRAGGVIDGAGGSQQVSIWRAPLPQGPWTLEAVAPVPGRDGPNETIYGIAPGRSVLVAFGFRRSPTENYPRPSVWTASPVPTPVWREVLESREFFGGPDIVGFGGLSSGPHGWFVGGTWTDPRGRAEPSIWRSVDGHQWLHDATDPAFEPGPGETPLVSGVADGPNGALLVATSDVPIPADPLARIAAAWWSGTGARWERVPLSSPPGSSTFDAVTATDSGWLIAGTESIEGRPRAELWTLGADLRLSDPFRLPGGPGTPMSLQVDGDRVLVGGASGPRAALWTLRYRRGILDRPSVALLPGTVPFQIDSVRVAASGRSMVVSVAGADRSEVWFGTPAP